MLGIIFLWIIMGIAGGLLLLRGCLKMEGAITGLGAVNGVLVMPLGPIGLLIGIVFYALMTGWFDKVLWRKK